MKDYSGPAFPGEYVKHPVGEVGNKVAIKEVGSGMTLRDYFAAMAMAAIAAEDLRQDESLENIAAAAYVIADAMLLERAK